MNDIVCNINNKVTDDPLKEYINNVKGDIAAIQQLKNYEKAIYDAVLIILSEFNTKLEVKSLLTANYDAILQKEYGVIQYAINPKACNVLMTMLDVYDVINKYLMKKENV
jgi:hypothetical protein